MFDQPADAAAHGPSPAPAGMRELTPRPPGRPAGIPMPTVAASALYPGYETPMSGVGLVAETSPDRPGPDDSVVARDDHLEGTFISRGTIHVMGSVKGRIEAPRLHIADGARVEAEVVVDEAVIAGEFIGNLTCRQRLEARASGRLSGLIETYRVMLHEGASVEGEVRMLPEPGRAGVDTIRGSAPIRGGVPIRGGQAGGAVPDGVVAAGSAAVGARTSTPASVSGADGPAPSPGIPEVTPRTTPRSSARPATASPSADPVAVTPGGSSPAGNGTHSGV
jgi:cytoskeletal protein CcmA (bactofilin family)